MAWGDVTNCIHATVNPVKTTRSQAPSDGTACKPGRTQLSNGHDSVLTGGQMRDRDVCGALRSHTNHKAPQGEILPVRVAGYG